MKEGKLRYAGWKKRISVGSDWGAPGGDGDQEC